VLKDNTRAERDIKVAFGGTPIGPWKNISPAFTDHFTEGPTAVKIKDRWVIYYDSYRDKRYGAVTTTDFIRFAPADSIISVPAGHKHGTIVPVKRATLTRLLKSLKK
jgi:hypothetical protein